jgi:FkbM family methyltransferase
MKRRPFVKRVLLRLARTFRPVLTVPYRGRRLTIDTRDLWIGGELFYWGSWQPILMGVVRRLGLEGQVAIDVGANIGVFTTELSDAVGVRGRVVAIEPGPDAFAILRANAERLSPNVTLIHGAASSSIGEAVIHASPNDLGGARMNAHQPCERCARVETTTIDTLTATFEDGAVGLMKIDVQGSEPAVVAGAGETLRRNPDLILILEVETDGTRALVSELWREGWRGWELAADSLTRLANGAPANACCDLLLARSENARARLDQAVTAR